MVVTKETTKMDKVQYLPGNKSKHGARTPMGIILGLNQRFQREARIDPKKMYSVKELAEIFFEKVKIANKFIPQETENKKWN